MPNDTSMLPAKEFNGELVYTELYPEDKFGLREVPIVHKNVYGHKSRIEMKKLNKYEYLVWQREQV